MVFKYPDAGVSPAPRRHVWLVEAIKESRYDFDQVQAEVTFEFVPNPGPVGTDHFFAYTYVTGNRAITQIATDLADPNRPGNDGGAPAGTFRGKQFYQETIIHEIAHTVMGAFFSDAWIAEVCALFGAPPTQWSTPVRWDDRIIEATAETFKDLFTKPEHRKFLNRTQWILPQDKVHDFVKHFTVQNPVPASGGGIFPGLLPAPPPQELMVEWSVSWSGNVVTRYVTQIPPHTDGNGVNYPGFVSETPSPPPPHIAPPTAEYDEFYPSYFRPTGRPPPFDVEFEPAVIARTGLRRPRYGDNETPTPPSRREPMVAAAIGSPLEPVIDGGVVVAINGGTPIVGLDFRLPGHINRIIVPDTELYTDGLPKTYHEQYPDHHLDAPNQRAATFATGETSNVWGSERVVYDANNVPVSGAYPTFSKAEYHYQWSWPTDMHGGGYSLADLGGGVVRVDHGWVYQEPPSVGRTPAPVAGRVTTRGSWKQELFQQQLPVYPGYGPKPQVPGPLLVDRLVLLGLDAAQVRYQGARDALLVEQAVSSLHVARARTERSVARPGVRRVVGREGGRIVFP